MNPNEQNLEETKKEIWALDIVNESIMYVGAVIDSSKLKSFNLTSNSSSEILELSDVICLNNSDVNNVMKNTGRNLFTILTDCYLMKDCYTIQGEHSVLTDKVNMKIPLNQIKMPYFLGNIYAIKDKNSDKPKHGFTHG
jgi:hypothetical protein